MKIRELLVGVFGTNKPVMLLPATAAWLAGIEASEASEKFRATIPHRIRTSGKSTESFPRKGENWNGSVDLPGLEIVGNLAVIPVYGLIGDKLDPLAKWYFNATDVRDVQAEIGIVESTAAVEKVVFAIDSPGGSSSSIPETGDMIQGMKKSTVAWVDNMAASAGYWLAAATGRIAATRRSDIGSIGVYSTFMDMSEFARQQGIEVQVFSSGKYKGMGVPGTSLSSDQSALIQGEVEDLASEFRSFVRTARMRDIPDALMEGQTFSGSESVTHGLIDSTGNDMSSALRLK